VAQAVLVSDRVLDILHAKSIVLDLEYYENASYYNSLDRAQAEAPYRPVRIRIVSELAQLVAPERHLSGGRGHAASSLTGCSPPPWAPGRPTRSLRAPQIFSEALYPAEIRHQEGERRALYLHWRLVSTNYAKKICLFDLGDLIRQQYHDLAPHPSH
jgi:ATP-binding cassette subfamily B protein